MVGSNIDDKDQKKAILLHVAGEAVREIYYAQEDASHSYKEIQDILSAHFDPMKNVDYAIYKLGMMKQNSNESMDDFVVRLRAQAAACNFKDKDEQAAEIKKQVIRGCISARFKEKVLEKDGSTLDDILKLARNGEAVKLQASYIEESKDVKVKCESIAAVAAMGAHKQRGNKEGSSGWKFKAKEQHKPRSDKKCYACGYEYPHEKECPAKGKKCNSCKQIGHFERCCKDKSRQRGLKAVGKGSESPTFEEEEEDGFLFTSSNDAMGQGKKSNDRGTNQQGKYQNVD